jgi:hypothetical protein
LAVYFLGAGAERAELSMCEKCKELDDKIERCNRIIFGINDQLTIDRIKLLVDELRNRKAQLHYDVQ